MGAEAGRLASMHTSTGDCKDTRLRVEVVGGGGGGETALKQLEYLDVPTQSTHPLAKAIEAGAVWFDDGASPNPIASCDRRCGQSRHARGGKLPHLQTL